MNKSSDLYYITLLMLSFLLFSCGDSIYQNEFIYPPDNKRKVSISQGVWGNVWFWEGNFMPIIDPDHAKITPVVREIYIYEATTDSMVESLDGTFFRSINSTLIKTVQSDIHGFFQITLEPGKYSFFVKEDSLYYANGGDGEGHILPADITTNKVTKRQIDITYKAVY